MLLCAWLASTILVTKLPQGLFQKKLNLQITSHMWKVLITVEDGLIQWNDVMRAVTSLMDLNHSHMDTWSSSQLLQLQDRISHLSQSHQRRQKRGLIDGIGWVAHSLFGLATDSEVVQIKEKIEENRRWQQSMSTWSEDFVIVINKTREDMAKNQALLNDITEKTLKSIDEAHLMTWNMVN